MTWTYKPEDLATSKKDQVRFMLGDTTETAGLLQDEEITYLLEKTNGDVLRASLQGCQAIISQLSSLIDFKVGPYSESHGNRLKSYTALYEQLVGQITGIQAPLAKEPTTSPVFKYDMMTKGGCDHG